MFTPESRSGLAALGLGPVAERVYVFLVEAGTGQTSTAVAQDVGIPLSLVGEALVLLEDQFLIVRSPTQPPQYSARPPELALDSLVLRRGDELAQVRLYAKELQSRYREFGGRGAPADLLEVVVGERQVLRHYAHLLDSAKRELSVFTMPPYVVPGRRQDVDQVLRSEREGIRRGVRYRTVYDSRAVDDPFTQGVAQDSVALGEEARLIGELPMKLLLMDRAIGFVPLQTEDPGAGSLIVRPSPLLDVLIALFESVWIRAVPLGPLADPGRPAELDERAQRILLLMSSGLKDESIARALGTSRRTVQKHVSSIMETLGARTRFQAALLARDRGWVKPSDTDAG